jgi:16S rRNA processing protein RimM
MGSALRSEKTPPADPSLLAVGVVTGTHGVAGELKVKCLSGEPDHVASLHEALFRMGGIEKRLRVAGTRPHPHGLIMAIEGVDTPELAQRLVGSEILMPRKDATPLAEEEYYTADLCRCSLWFGEREIGPVRSVWDGGPAQLLEVEASGRTVLIPFTAHFIGAVEVERGRIQLLEDEILK